MRGRLFHAAESGNAEEMRGLLDTEEGRAAVDTEVDGWTALRRVCKNGHVDCVDALIEAGANMDLARDWDQLTALHFASFNGRVKCVEALLRAGATVDCVDINGATPLMIATGNGETECVRLLLEHSADVSKIDNSGWPALRWACFYGRTQTATFLLEHGASTAEEWMDGEAHAEATAFRDNLIAELGGIEVLQAEHQRWLGERVARQPGRRTKAAR